MNMLSSVAPWELVAAGYQEITMNPFQHFADKALALSKVDRDSHILDIACGPGTLTLIAAPQVRSVKAIDFSAGMISLLQDSIRQEGITNIETHCGDAQQLPYADNSFDAAYSMFGLMFFPDRMQGYKEIYRTLKPGGKVIISSWVPVTQSPAMQLIFGAVRAINPDLPKPEANLDSLENPDFFRSELEAAGFRDVEILGVSNSLPINSIERFWQDMVKGNAILAVMKEQASEEEWREKDRIAIEYLNDTLESVPTTLSMDAWLGVGTK